MTTSNYQHPTTGPISLRIEDRFPGRIDIDVIDTGSAEITVTTGDTSGPAHQAVHDTRINADKNSVTVTIPAPQGRAGGGVFISGDNYGAISVGGGTVVVNGIVITGGAASGPVYVLARLPRGSVLTGATSSTDLGLTGGVLARVDFQTSSGNIHGACADTIDARTSSGDVRIHAAGTASATTSSGDITINTAGTVNARTSSGDIRLARCDGPADLTTSSGDVHAPEHANVRTSSGRITRTRSGR